MVGRRSEGPIRGIRIGDHEWQAAKAAAKAENMTASAWIRRLIQTATSDGGNTAGERGNTVNNHTTAQAVDTLQGGA